MPIAALRAGLNPRPSRKALAGTALKGRMGVRHMAPISVRLTLTIGMPTRAIHTASRHRHGAGPASSAISSAVRLAAGRNGKLLVVPAGRRLGKGRAWPRLVIVMRSQNEELERIEGVAHRMATFLDLGLLESGSRGSAVTFPLATKTNMWSAGVSEHKPGSSDC